MYTEMLQQVLDGIKANMTKNRRKRLKIDDLSLPMKEKIERINSECQDLIDCER